MDVQISEENLLFERLPFVDRRECSSLIVEFLFCHAGGLSIAFDGGRCAAIVPASDKGEQRTELDAAHRNMKRAGSVDEPARSNLGGLRTGILQPCFSAAVNMPFSRSTDSMNSSMKR